MQSQQLYGDHGDLMTSPGFNRLMSLALGAGLMTAVNANPARAQNTNDSRPDSYRWNNRAPDPRYKADILLVVAHPDDEVMATAYLAREIYDNHKKVAVVYETAGDGGNNDVGAEQGASLGEVRKIEALRAVGSLGITNVWFLSGHDTPSQNVLNSLEHCGHGACLDELIRIVRITRPSVILTWLPDFATGENHADHQASGVLATEAFDLAGDPTVFSEQVSPATNPDKNPNLTEALRPWQTQKIYYFYNATHDISSGQGPRYSSQEISPSRHLSYGVLAAQMFTNHLSQGGEKVLNQLADNTLASSPGIGKIATGSVQLILGKSLVPSGVTDDVFAGVVADGIPYQRAPGFIKTQHSEPTLEIGDPWSYYHKFWQAHGLDHLANIVPTEISVHVDGTLAIPLIVDNPLNTTIETTFSVKAPDGWKVNAVAPASIAPHSQFYLRVLAVAPPTKLPGWQEFTISAESQDKTIGTVPIRVELSDGWVAPQ
jgi:LmbE family N-acetylglucosaminyl deacetylase